MNKFSVLDRFFPCGEARLSGEVVNIELRIYRCDHDAKAYPYDPIVKLNWKRKAWYVNASVNAFHMHRGLCREFSEATAYGKFDKVLPAPKHRVVTPLIAQAVLASYYANASSMKQTGYETQGFTFGLILGSDEPTLYELSEVGSTMVFTSVKDFALSHVYKLTGDPRFAPWELVPFEFSGDWFTDLLSSSLVTAGRSDDVAPL